MVLSLTTSIFLILFSSIGIYFAGNIFAKSSSAIGDYFNLPRDVKGATLDAISSSLPELLVALFSVIIFKKFEVGIGTIAGSALFNLLIIPGICVFLSPVIFKVGKKVISRDALFYLIAVFVLTMLVLFFKNWGLIISLVLLGFYLIYLSQITKHTLAHRKTSRRKKLTSISLPKELATFFITMLVIGLFAYLLTDSSIALAELLEVSPAIIAFTITAAATSVPDTIISAVNAKKGDIDDATSNVFGSNIFDIFVGLGLPLLIYSIFSGPVKILFSHLELLIGLFISTMVVIYFFGKDHILTKKEGASLIIIYLLFVLYVLLFY